MVPKQCSMSNSLPSKLAPHPPEKRVSPVKRASRPRLLWRASEQAASQKLRPFTSCLEAVSMEGLLLQNTRNISEPLKDLNLRRGSLVSLRRLGLRRLTPYALPAHAVPCHALPCLARQSKHHASLRVAWGADRLTDPTAQPCSHYIPSPASSNKNLAVT